MPNEPAADDLASGRSMSIDNFRHRPLGRGISGDGKRAPGRAFPRSFRAASRGREGREIVHTMKDGRTMAWAMIVRTQVFDEIIMAEIATRSHRPGAQSRGRTGRTAVAAGAAAVAANGWTSTYRSILRYKLATLGRCASEVPVRGGRGRPHRRRIATRALRPHRRAGRNVCWS